MDDRIRQLEDRTSRQDTKIAVFERVVGELSNHMSKVEDKLDKLHEAHLATQGTMRAILDIRTEFKEWKNQYEAKSDERKKQYDKRMTDVERKLYIASGVVIAIGWAAPFIIDKFF